MNKAEFDTICKLVVDEIGPTVTDNMLRAEELYEKLLDLIDDDKSGTKEYKDMQLELRRCDQANIYILDGAAYALLWALPEDVSSYCGIQQSLIADDKARRALDIRQHLKQLIRTK